MNRLRQERESSYYKETLVGPEVFSVDYLSPVISASNGNGFLLNGISEGHEISQRRGRVARVVGVEFNGSVSSQSTTLCAIRALMVVDHAANGAELVINNVLQGATKLNFATGIMYPYNRDSRDRISVLADVRLSGQTNGTTMVAVQVPFNHYYAVNVDTVYMGTANTIASISSGAIWFWCNGGFVGSIRVYFVDE